MPVLRDALKKRGVDRAESFPKAAYDRLVEEAYRRAAACERDKLARYKPLFSEIETVADEVERLFRSSTNGPSAVKSILEFYRLLH